MSETRGPTEHAFQAEVRELLHLVVHSLYQNSEVFLRELISNASDALDKARFLAVAKKDEVVEPDGELEIRIRADEERRTLVVEDDGVGMTEEEVVQNLGTIAKSGTAEFMRRMKEGGDAPKLIGQFGVGFYAAFMVASRVDVDTLSMQKDAKPVLWRSMGAGSFTVQPGERTRPGTTITLHLKDDAREFLKPWRIKEIVAKYSDFVPFPVRSGGETLNRGKPLWTLSKSQITDEQHAELFRHLGGVGEPLTSIHVSIDAPVQFQALLYVPSKAPRDLFTREQRGPRLYAKRVLIMEECEKLLPPWLRFVKGVVDSEDLSLNVSRETLQDTRTLQAIHAQLVRQVLKSLRELADGDPEKYARFWEELGRVLKEGVSLDFKHRDEIAELSRFETLLTCAPEGEPAKRVSLGAYVDAMPAEQKEIFFITGPTRRAVERSPHVEAFRKKGWDVLLLSDPIDEWVVEALPEFRKLKLRSVVHGEIDLGPPEKGGEHVEAAAAAVKKALEGRVKDVRLSSRLTETASCLVSEEGALGVNMERILKMVDQEMPVAKRILELNPAHPAVENLGRLASRAPESPELAEWSEILLEQALLAEGIVEDPAKLVRHLQGLLAQVSAQRS